MKTLFLMLRKHIAILIRNVVHSEKLTCWPDAPRKSKARILADNLLWILRFGCANGYYYILGLDCKNTPAHHQKNISGRRARLTRDRKSRTFCNNYWKYDALVNDKFVASRYMDVLGIPVPKMLALVFHSSVLLPESGEELPLGALMTEQQALFSDCICKPVAEGQGRGVFHLEIKEGQLFSNRNRIDHQHLINMFSKSKYIIQERVIQHQRMSNLNPHCVNTIRLVTCIHEGAVMPFSAGVRLGIKGNITDNWHTGGILIRLNMETRCLNQHGFTLPEHGGKKYEKHPETGVTFEGYEIPFATRPFGWP